MGLFFDAALAALGGQRVGAQLTLDNAFGMGDDDGTLEDDFSAWREAVWPDVMQMLKMEDKQDNRTQQFALTCGARACRSCSSGLPLSGVQVRSAQGGREETEEQEHGEDGPAVRALRQGCRYREPRAARRCIRALVPPH